MRHGGLWRRKLDGLGVSLSFDRVKQRAINEVFFEPLDGRRSGRYGRQIGSKMHGEDYRQVCRMDEVRRWASTAGEGYEGDKDDRGR